MYKLFVLSVCKDTTNNPNTQVFRQKNAKNLSFSLQMDYNEHSKTKHNIFS